jgi:hypothetical protein
LAGLIRVNNGDPRYYDHLRSSVLYRPELETAAPEAIRNAQLARLNDLLSRVLPCNSFYTAKAGTTRIPVSWADFERFPFTTKGDLVADQEASPPLGTIATYPPDQYVVYHQTSGTTGGRNAGAMCTAQRACARAIEYSSPSRSALLLGSGALTPALDDWALWPFPGVGSTRKDVFSS